MSSNVCSAAVNAGSYLGSSSLCRNGNPVATIACSGRAAAHVDAALVAERSPTLAGAVRAVEQRRVHDADHRLAVDDEADRHADRFEPVHEVRGAVERIDEPTGVGARRRPLPRRTPRGRSRVRAPRAPRLRSRCRPRSPSRRAPSRARRAACRSARARSRRPRAARVSAAASSASRSRRHVTRRRRHRARRASSGVPAAITWRRALRIVGHELFSVRVAHDRARFDAREVTAEIVPRREVRRRNP